MIGTSALGRPARALLLALLLLFATAASLAAQALELRFLDVGQGDAILLRSEGKAALIDAGPTDDVVGRLRALGVSGLDLLLASHNHADHIGGADAVLSELPVRFYLDNGRPATTRIQRRVLALVERKGITYLRASPRTLTLGSATLTILPSPLAGRVRDQNDQSVMVLVEQGGFRALLAGDAEVGEIDSLLAAGRVPDVDVLKADHHGSRNGFTPEWLARARPEVVVISAGAGNVYHHPHPEALRAYAAVARRVYRTDLDGTVTVRVDSAGGYTVSAERADPDSLFVGPPTIPGAAARPAAVERPAASAGGTSPATHGATARCRDGTLSFSAHRRGTCSRHGGVAVWLRRDPPSD